MSIVDCCDGKKKMNDGGERRVALLWDTQTLTCTYVSLCSCDNRSLLLRCYFCPPSLSHETKNQEPAP